MFNIELMSHFIIRGGKRLSGTITVGGSKNAALPLLASTILTSEEVTLKNIPQILDIKRLIDILRALGMEVSQDNHSITARAANIDPAALPTDLVGMLRGSILLMGALLGRLRQVSLPRPGGDVIGARPIDTHLDAFAQLGVKITDEGDTVTLDGSALKAGTVVLREFSVTATENTLLVAATLPGTTTIHCAATEPHVVALAQLLTAMGAKITGAGTHTITVHGKKKLKGATFTNIPDMLEAGFFMLFGAATKSELTIQEVPVADLPLFFKKLDDIGITYTVDAHQRQVTVHPSEFKSFKMQSLPHPGIATDLQAPFSVIATQAHGSSLIHDPMYEGRLKHIVELQKMGANAVICDPHRVIVTGPTKLRGRVIPSLDIRSGATLIMAGLIAEGETTIEQADIIERGYEQLAERLQAVGADIKKVAD
jgi:UDP-N-acetylglucosamine 1-carboxyvinyltransferase